MSYRLQEIGAAQIPGNPGCFYPGEYIKPGMPRFKGVGEKLAESLKNFSVSIVSASRVSFFLAHDPVPDVLPKEVSGEEGAFSWWALYQMLAWPSEEVQNALPNGTQLGCPVELLEDIVVRVQVDWANGHSIGRRPAQEGWTWNKGTVFAANHYLF